VTIAGFDQAGKDGSETGLQQRTSENAIKQVFILSY
jgi:hypothetical protein